MRPDLIRDPLLEWFATNARDLPWRRSKDPYAIWVSEAMLQQTQVATVIPYYERWMARFPTVEALAHADESAALALWQGLGYYRRCRMLQVGARQIVVQGTIPHSAKAWRTIPGVGPYTANAIASMCFQEPVAVVDGNVERVFARLTASRASGGALNRAAWKWAEAMLHESNPGDWNQALMELGATICTPRTPDCLRCPIRHACISQSMGIQSELPLRPAKQSAVARDMYLVIPIWSSAVGLRPIPDGKWWSGLWTAPLFDTEEEASAFCNGINLPEWPRALPPIRHTVTHHRIRLHPWIVTLDGPIPETTFVPITELPHVPMPRPHRRAVELALTALGLEPTRSP